MPVPPQYIRDAPIDWRLELMQAAGQSLPFGSSEIPAPTFGVWALLELCDCDLVHPGKESTPFGAVMAAYIAATGERAAGFVDEYLTSDNKPTALEEAADCPLMSRAIVWAEAVEATPQQYGLLQEWLCAGFAGFAMIPGDGDGGEWIFSVESLGSMVASIGPALGVGWKALMWETPLIVIGHTVAQAARQNGSRGVARPKDLDHIKECFAIERECRETGKLYPWQEAMPLHPVCNPDGHESEDEYYRLAVLQHEARKGVTGG